MKPLRKAHRRIWTAWAILLPLGILVSWLVIPNPMPVKALGQPGIELLPVIKHSEEKPAYCLRIRSDEGDSKRQLEWWNKLPLTVPSAVIYKTRAESKTGTFDPGSAELIGRIETKGSHVFPLAKDSSANQELHFVLYDFIHQQIIDQFKFTP